MCHCPYPQLWKPKFRGFVHRVMQKLKPELQDSTKKLILFETDYGKVRASLVAQRVKKYACNSREWILSLGWEDPPGDGTGNPLEYSSLENSVDRGAWWVKVHGVSKSCT